jgi:cellulose synthase/poly-beta-1,6-N-acetylglucosamine synthase-like glycosyltransferase
MLMTSDRTDRPHHTGEQATGANSVVRSRPSCAMYVSIILVWAASVGWFLPRMLLLLRMSQGPLGTFSIGLFVFFMIFAWLYGIYNVLIVLFGLWYRWFADKPEQRLQVWPQTTPPVAILYTTCNDFVERSALSCVQQDYPNFRVYVLDDSRSEEYQRRIDEFASVYPDTVVVVRRRGREGYKAGNLNNGLTTAAAAEKYFAIADADEILPGDFLTRLVPLMEADDSIGFVQANHRANPDNPSLLARQLGVGIDIHWQWYQPLRNDFGFVMFLGHGALLRRNCWVEVGGFPHIVSEDLGYAIAIRELGYRGVFAESVICLEDFPETVRSFRIRHMKWTRGTCEFLSKKLMWLLRARHISLMEKLDIIFPTMNLPLTLLYLLFMLNANVLLPALFGKFRVLTLVVAGYEIRLPTVSLDQGFAVIHGVDFLVITLMTFFSPILCFMVALALQPIRLFRFLCHSTSLYAALSPLSSIGVVSFLCSGQATFLVTGDVRQVFGNGSEATQSRSLTTRFWAMIYDLVQRSHPDQGIVQVLEISIGLIICGLSVLSVQVSLFGLSLAFLMLPLMHRMGWENRFVAVAVYFPFLAILAGMLLTGLSMAGMQPVFFGYGFHF